MDGSASATRESKEFSVTVRPGDVDGVDKYLSKFLNFMDENCSHYCIGIEQKGDLSTQHFQCAVVVKMARRSDNLKVSLIRLLGDSWNDDQKRVAVKVVKNRESNDVRILAGGYCSKQDGDPYLKGWTSEELEPYSKTYEELKQSAELRNISKDRIVDILKGYHDELAQHKNPDVRDNFSVQSHRERIRTVFQYAIAHGANLQKYSTPVWINYFVDNYSVLFNNLSAEGIIEMLSVPRI